MTVSRRNEMFFEILYVMNVCQVDVCRVVEMLLVKLIEIFNNANRILDRNAFGLMSVHIIDYFSGRTDS